MKTLEKFLFDAVKITKNADNSKCKYFGYGIGFHGKEALSHQSGGFGNLVVFYNGFIYDYHSIIKELAEEI